MLVIEEDPTLSGMLASALADQHLVVTAASFPEALASYAARQAAGGRSAPDATVIGFPTVESRGFGLLLQGVEAFPTAARNTVVLLPAVTRAATRDRLVQMGWLILRHPLDMDALRSMLVRITPEPTP